ncbi:MAG TPA: bifunctional riboflavin kinase/FMN adenylyltransferase [Firmicutes bacterium]|nr:bifunctional riboflavin kinase/FMN adenylyltransferase [Bacillota bacterium]
MEVIYYEGSPINLDTPLSIALGYFDGLHLAHQEVIERAVAYGRKHNLKSAVMTFSPNPNVVLKKLESDHLLTPPTEKVRLLETLGVDYLVILPFDETLAQLSATDFVQKYLIDLGVLHVATGFDFRFGRMGEGDTTFLQQYPNSFTMSVIEKRELHDEKIGATQIKNYLSNGMIEKVNLMLGRPYRITGKVVTGAQKGRTIGFPTANLALEAPYVIPKKGVYAVKVWIDNHEYMGMCNIGHNPTFNFNNDISIEVHVLEFEGDLYGQTLQLDFYHYLRTEKKFPSIDVLMEQLHNDKKEVKSYFGLDLN